MSEGSITFSHIILGRCCEVKSRPIKSGVPAFDWNERRHRVIFDLSVEVGGKLTYLSFSANGSRGLFSPIFHSDRYLLLRHASTRQY